jgi:very-short-patch-repair endonuclease
VLLERAAQMRHAPTASEAQLFEALRGGALGVTFRRQVPLLGRYIADLLAPELRLVVEVDGGYHVQRGRADARRDRALARAGYVVVHVEAERVHSELTAVVEGIRAVVAELRGR